MAHADFLTPRDPAYPGDTPLDRARAGMASGQRRAPRPSLPLAVLLFFGSYWSLLFFIILCIELIWKGERGSLQSVAGLPWVACKPDASAFRAAGSNLPYTNTGFGLDVAIILLWAIIEPIRLHLAKQGNKSGIAMALVWQVCPSMPGRHQSGRRSSLTRRCPRCRSSCPCPSRSSTRTSSPCRRTSCALTSSSAGAGLTSSQQRQS